MRSFNGTISPKANPWRSSRAVVLKEQSPDVIGISIRNIDNCEFYEQHLVYGFLSPDGKCSGPRLTENPVVLGGPGYSLFPEALLRGGGCGLRYMW